MLVAHQSTRNDRRDLGPHLSCPKRTPGHLRSTTSYGPVPTTVNVRLAWLVPTDRQGRRPRWSPEGAAESRSPRSTSRTGSSPATPVGTAAVTSPANGGALGGIYVVSGRRSAWWSDRSRLRMSAQRRCCGEPLRRRRMAAVVPSLRTLCPMGRGDARIRTKQRNGRYSPKKR